MKDQQFLIESSKDSSRLLSKNSCKILLNEEKIRKRINKTLPKLIDNLKKETSQYNNDAIQMGKRTLFINGEDFSKKYYSLNQNNLKYQVEEVNPHHGLVQDKYLNRKQWHRQGNHQGVHININHQSK